MYSLLRSCAEGMTGQAGGMTLPCPAGKEALPVCGVDAVCPVGKSASELARLILVCRGGKLDEEMVCPSRTVWQARRRDGVKGPHWTVRAFRCEHPARGSAQDHLPTPSASPVPRNHPAGRTAGSARTRSRDQSLENPFLGSGGRLPQNAAGGRPLLVGLPPSTPSTAPSGTKQSAQAPYSWGLGASASSRRRWLPTLSGTAVTRTRRAAARSHGHA